MKTKSKIIIAAVAVLAIACVIAILPNFSGGAERNRAIQALRGLPRDRVESAIAAFANAQKAKEMATGDTVSLRELVAGGFLRADEAAPFANLDTVFMINIDMTVPNSIIARVPLANGTDMVQLEDGTIVGMKR